MKKDFGRLLIIVGVALALVGGLTYYTQRGAVPEVLTQVENGSVVLSIQGLYTNKQESLSSEESVMQVLKAANAADPRIQLTTKDYPGMGELVTGIGTLKNGDDNKYWQYKVNGAMPQIGADQYKLKSGDSIEWYFAGSQE